MQVQGGPPISSRPEQMIGFLDAQKKALMMDYFNFRGRASRSEFWWFYLAMSGIFAMGWSFDTMFGIVLIEIIPESGVGFGPFYILSVLGLFIPVLSSTYRRLHDTGRSGWWYFLIFIPCIGIIVLLAFLAVEGQSHPNEYGDVPNNRF